MDSPWAYEMTATSGSVTEAISNATHPVRSHRLDLGPGDEELYAQTALAPYPDRVRDGRESRRLQPSDSGSGIPKRGSLGTPTYEPGEAPNQASWVAAAPSSGPSPLIGWEISHSKPKGSSALKTRSPQGSSRGSLVISQPAF